MLQCGQFAEVEGTARVCCRLGEAVLKLNRWWFTRGSLLPFSHLFVTRAGRICCVFLISWIVAVSYFSVQPLQLVVDYGGYILLGLTGAIFANATGAGGGVVFIPVFSQLQFSPQTAVATSFAIQCFGMTAGALTWWQYYRKEKQPVAQWQSFTRLLYLSVPFAVVGILAMQFSGLAMPNDLHFGFGVFSIVLASALFATIPLLNKQHERDQLARIDCIVLPIIGLLGGALTAWLSVGVGELLAVYLLFRGFDATFSVACAVVLTGISVWFAVVYHAVVMPSIYWPIVAFAGLGAVAGGMIAKRIVLLFAPLYVKLFFASWVMLSGWLSVI